MKWRVQIAKEFEPEFFTLQQEVQDTILTATRLMRLFGQQLECPQVDTLNGSRHSNMKEMRLRAADGESCVAFAFDPVRSAILLVAGDKSGSRGRRFYRELISKAHESLDRHLARLADEWDEEKCHGTGCGRRDRGARPRATTVDRGVCRRIDHWGNDVPGTV